MCILLGVCGEGCPGDEGEDGRGEQGTQGQTRQGGGRVEEKASGKTGKSSRYNRKMFQV